MMQLHVILIIILFIITILIPRKYAVDIKDVGLIATNLGQCQGDCDNDGECQGNLICYQRYDAHDPAPPGCSGTPFDNWDYCQPQYINIGISPSGSLGVCEGDCDNDSQCEGNLICYQRNLHEPGPYECSGTPNEDWDYCYHPQVLTDIDLTATHLGICEGDCDNDDQCAGDLKCFHRNNNDPSPPGCSGTPTGVWDYCYLPTYINIGINPTVTLGLCEGDCDNDDQCSGNLQCYQRNAGDRGPPGCSGIPNMEWDYCVEPGIITDLGISVNHLGLCQGDCDNDAACNGDLKCYHRPGFEITYLTHIRKLQSIESIPGCSGTGTDSWDYCYAPTYTNIGGDPTVTLGLCEGDCDNDDQCSGDLKCYQRSGSETGPPECFGTPNDWWDYCYMPEIHNVGFNPTVSLRLCEGDCDNDDQCAGDLKCYQRTGSEPGPPECEGTPFIDWDYCYAPCERHRKEWNSLTSSEKQDYFDAFKQLIDNNVIQMFSTAHNDLFGPAHTDPKFWPWHRQFIYALESEIRALPGYECFSLPYWDWTNSATRWDVINDLSDNNWLSGCPGSSSIFDEYNPANPSYSCLTRSVNTGGAFTDYTTIMDMIDDNDAYSNIRPLFEGSAHNRPHSRVGGNMASTYSPDDPLFYLHHNFVDYAWALWQDCNNYDGVTHTTGSDMYSSDVNELLTFGSSGIASIQVKDTTDISTINGEGYSYEKGPFWDNARVDDTDNCDHPINAVWFKHSGGRRRRLREKFEDDIWDRLINEGYKGKELRHKYFVQVCQHKQNGYYSQPDNFEDCSNIPGDVIDISLDELLNKKGLNDGMKQTRKDFYQFAKITKSLRSLCDGCYDFFCEQSDALKRKCVQDGHHENKNAALGPKIYHMEPEAYNEFMDDIQNKKNYFVITISQNSMYILIILVFAVVVILVGINITYLCMKSKNKQKGYASVKLFTDSEYDTESPIMQ